MKVKLQKNKKWFQQMVSEGMGGLSRILTFLLDSDDVEVQTLQNIKNGKLVAFVRNGVILDTEEIFQENYDNTLMKYILENWEYISQINYHGTFEFKEGATIPPAELLETLTKFKRFKIGDTLYKGRLRKA